MSIVSVPKALREKLGDDGVDGLIEVISEIEKEAREDSLVLAEERFERRITEEFSPQFYYRIYACNHVQK